MTEIKRWHLPFDFGGVEMEVSSGGNYVRYDDHLAEISALRARVAELEARATPPDSDAVRAERERCAKIAARLLKGYDNGDDGFGVEEAIRSGRAAK